MADHLTRPFAALVAVRAVAGCSVPRPSPATTDGPPATSAPAPAATGRAPTETYDVQTRKLALNRDGDRALPVTIWYPDAEPGRFPVILFSHGLGGRPADYEQLLEQWAAAGFVVAAPTYPHTSRGTDNNPLDVLNQPADASYVLSQVLALDKRAGDRLRGRLATDRVAAAGHSAGGITTVGLFTVGRDERLDAGIVLAGSALGIGVGFTGPAAPLLFVHGERDNVVSYASGKAVYDRVPWPKALLSLPDGDHGQTLLRDGNEAFEVVADSTVDFWRWSLYGDANAKRRLPDDATKGGLATLDDQL